MRNDKLSLQSMDFAVEIINKGGFMGFFTCILILIVLYCPWLIPVLFVVFILSMISSIRTI